LRALKLEGWEKRGRSSSSRGKGRALLKAFTRKRNHMLFFPPLEEGGLPLSTGGKGFFLSRKKEDKVVPLNLSKK